MQVVGCWTRKKESHPSMKLVEIQKKQIETWPRSPQLPHQPAEFLSANYLTCFPASSVEVNIMTHIPLQGYWEDWNKQLMWKILVDMRMKTSVKFLMSLCRILNPGYITHMVYLKFAKENLFLSQIPQPQGTEEASWFLWMEEMRSPPCLAWRNH